MSMLPTAPHPVQMVADLPIPPPHLVDHLDFPLVFPILPAIQPSPAIHLNLTKAVAVPSNQVVAPEVAAPRDLDNKRSPNRRSLNRRSPLQVAERDPVVVANHQVERANTKAVNTKVVSMKVANTKAVSMKAVSKTPKVVSTKVANKIPKAVNK